MTTVSTSEAIGALSARSLVRGFNRSLSCSAGLGMGGPMMLIFIRDVLGDSYGRACEQASAFFLKMGLMPKLSPAEPVSELRRIKIQDNGEPLVDFVEHCPAVIIDRPRFSYRRETLLRLGAADRLRKATALMPSGYRIAIVEGWRARHIQKRMYMAVWNRFRERHPNWSDVQLKRVVNRFTAPLDGRVPPPHSTGGAMDVFLVDDFGKPFDMRTPYEPHDPAGFALDAPGVSDKAKLHRRILADAMIEAGITNYPSEFWHFSYGDQGWAYRGGHPVAIYGPVIPENWVAEPADLIDEPLVFIARDD